MFLHDILFRLKRYISDNLWGHSYILRPNFLIPGASRSGSTTLYFYLRQHPEIFFGRLKEPFFFNVNYDLGIEWYLSNYRSSKDYPAIGDSSARYYDSAIATKRLYNFNPDFKLIFILRQPVERLISGYRLSFHRGETRSFEQFIKKDNYIGSSKYATHISRLLKYFPRRNMFFIIFEKFIKNKHKYLRDICEFLEINSKFKFNDKEIYKNPSMMPLSLTLQRLNTKLFKFNPKENIIIRSSKLGISELINLINYLPNSRKFPEINEKTRMVLNNYFEEEISNLEKLIEIKLDIWKQH